MSNGTILIVEDNDLSSLLLTDLLEVNGYATLRAHDGQEAMALVSDKEPDLIVLDVQLPVVSGIDVINWLKRDKRLRLIPVVVVTAFAMPTEEKILRAAGCDDYMAKPISILAFLKIVGQHLSRPQPSLYSV